MRLLSRVVRVGIGGVVILALPLLAAAQPFTLSGRLVEELPGGNAIPAPQVQISRVSPTGEFPSLVKFLEACEDGGTTDCVDTSGSFLATGLEPGTYKVYASAEAPGFRGQIRSVAVTSNTNIGDLQFLRLPFAIDISIADIPSGGGTVPVIVRGQKTWDVPTLPVTVRVERSFESINGYNIDLTPTILEFDWPASLVDTGFLPIASIEVAPTDPAGGQQCVNLQVRLRGNPDIVLGGAGTCKSKLP